MNCKWYVAVLIQRYQFNETENTEDVSDTCDVEENMYLIKANDSNEAYRKSLVLGRAMDNVECVDDQGKKGHWKFVGINELLPVYDDLEDGCELLWTTHYMSIREAESMVKQKKDLGVFRKD